MQPSYYKFFSFPLFTFIWLVAMSIYRSNMVRFFFFFAFILYITYFLYPLSINQNNREYVPSDSSILSIRNLFSIFFPWKGLFFLITIHTRLEHDVQEEKTFHHLHVLAMFSITCVEKRIVFVLLNTLHNTFPINWPIQTINTPKHQISTVARHCRVILD